MKRYHVNVAEYKRPGLASMGRPKSLLLRAIIDETDMKTAEKIFYVKKEQQRDGEKDKGVVQSTGPADVSAYTFLQRVTQKRKDNHNCTGSPQGARRSHLTSDAQEDEPSGTQPDPSEFWDLALPTSRPAPAPRQTTAQGAEPCPAQAGTSALRPGGPSASSPGS